MPIGYQESGTNDPVEDTSDYTDSMMITKDFNFVNIDFYLEYKVVNPETFLFNADEPLETLRNLTKASIRSTIRAKNFHLQMLMLIKYLKKQKPTKKTV